MGRIRLGPPSWYLLGSMVSVYAVFGGSMRYHEPVLGPPLLELKVRPGELVPTVAGAVHGTHRAVAFHPRHRARLEMTRLGGASSSLLA